MGQRFQPWRIIRLASAVVLLGSALIIELGCDRGPTSFDPSRWQHPRGESDRLRMIKDVASRVRQEQWDRTMVVAMLGGGTMKDDAFLVRSDKNARFMWREMTQNWDSVYFVGRTESVATMESTWTFLVFRFGSNGVVRDVSVLTPGY